MNAFIALASPGATSWPNTLFEAGYALEGRRRVRLSQERLDLQAELAASQDGGVDVEALECRSYQPARELRTSKRSHHHKL